MDSARAEVESATMIHLILANAAVTDLEVAEAWYRSVFGSPPDTRPMDELIASTEKASTTPAFNLVEVAA